MPNFLKLTFFFLFSFYILHTIYPLLARLASGGYIPTVYAQEDCEGVGDSPVGANLKLHQSFADDISRALIPPDINEASAAGQKVCTGIKQGISGLICNALSPFGIFESFCTQEVNLGRNTGTFNKQQKILSDAAGIYPYLQRSPQPYNEDIIKDARKDQTGNKILSAFADRTGRNNANYYTAGYLNKELRSKVLDERDSISIGGSAIDDPRTEQATSGMCLEFIGDYPPGHTPKNYREADCPRFLQPSLQTQTATSSGDYSIQAYMIYSSEPSPEDATRDLERLKRSLEASQEWYQVNVGKTFKTGQFKKAVVPESSDYLGWELVTIGDNLRRALYGDVSWPKNTVTILMLKDNVFDALGFAMGFDQKDAFIDYPNNGPGVLTTTGIAVGDDYVYSRLLTCNPSGAGCLNAQLTLSHELGHAFGLPHTETTANFLSNTKYSPIMLDSQKEFLKTSSFLK